MTKKDEFYLRIRFNEDLHAEFKALCAMEKKSMKEGIEDALKLYIESKKK
jgi:hypothetical protein